MSSANCVANVVLNGGLYSVELSVDGKAWAIYNDIITGPHTLEDDPHWIKFHLEGDEGAWGTVDLVDNAGKLLVRIPQASMTIGPAGVNEIIVPFKI